MVPFSEPLGLLPTIFEFPFSRYVYPYFFPTYDLFSHFLLQGSLDHLHTGLVVISLTSKQGWPTYGPTLSMAPIIFCLTPTPPRKRWSLTSNVTPTPQPTSPLHNNLHRIKSPALIIISTSIIFIISYFYHGFTRALPYGPPDYYLHLHPYAKTDRTWPKLQRPTPTLQDDRLLTTCCTTIAQSNIPISTAAHAHYLTFPSHTHVSYTFSNFFFKNFFGPNFGALALYFLIPLLPLRITIFWCRIHLWFRWMGRSANKVDDVTA